APLNGRPITADDVKYSIERQTAGDASFVRKASLVNIDKVESRDASTIVITMKAQQAAMVDLFADVNSFIVPPEATTEGRQFSIDSQPGSGPFRWVEWVEGQLGSVARNAAWFGGSNRPYLDGVAAIQPTDARDVEAGLRTKALDVAFVGRATADRLKQVLPSLQESTVGQLQFFGMRFFIPQVPYNDLRFRSAISIAIDRRDMVHRFFGGSGDINPWISWPLSRWTLPQSELSTIPGYRPGSGGRDQDITDAKALLAAFAASNKIPDELPLFVVADAETNLQMGSVIRDQLKQNLGLNVTVYPVATGELIRRLFAQDAPWAAGPDSSQIDLDDCVYPYFHSAGTQNTFPLRDSDMDALINAQRAELDEAKRREIGFDIQRKLLTLNVGVNLVSERVVALAWPYVRNFPLDSTDGYQNRFADCWIDKTDPTYRGR
ncbi:MAG TPA: ABC transporter substrate-binding protein, partial [Tepidiformaceae bacterium]